MPSTALYSEDENGQPVDEWVFEEILGDDEPDEEYRHDVMPRRRATDQYDMREWDPEEHPRDESGKFAPKGTSFDRTVLSEVNANALEAAAARVPDLAEAAKVHSVLVTGGATVAKASEFYIRSGDAGLGDYMDSKQGPETDEFRADKPWLKGQAYFQDHLVAAKMLVDAVREAPEVETTLYRGLSSQVAIDQVKHVEVGQTITMGRISAFSTDQEMARSYAAAVGGRKSERVMLKVVGPVKAIEMDSLTGMGMAEHVTQGRFEVVSRASGRRGTVITLKQTGVF